MISMINHSDLGGDARMYFGKGKEDQSMMGRETILLDRGWLFHRGEIEIKRPSSKGPIYSSAKTVRERWGPAAVEYNDHTDDYRPGVEFGVDRWDRVNLPHDYVIEGTFDPAENSALGYLRYENAWYRHHFTLSEEDRGKRIALYFEGIAGESEIFINGCPLYRNSSGYTSFEVEITDFAIFGGDNLIAVHLDLSRHEGWWYEGGGIYRHVWLLKTLPIHIDRWGVRIVPRRIYNTLWRTDVDITVRNSGDDDDVAQILTELLNPSGELVSSARTSISVAAHSANTGIISLYLDNPALWQVGQGALYSIRTSVLSGRGEDQTVDHFGFREILCDPERGLFVNGIPVKIKGVCGHYDCGLTGKAVPDNLFRHKVKMMREMGANGYRTSHYPQSEALMDALDEAGFIVLDEVRWFTSSEEGMKQLEMLIKRDRNRPSVFFWCIGNEEPLFTDPRGQRIAEAMLHLIRQLDPTRPVTAACDRPDRALIYGNMDVVGINYGLDSYDAVHEKYPAKPLMSTECCATGTTRGWYAPDSQDMRRPAYDRDTNDWFRGRERTWKFIMEREWVMGAFQWTAFEHRGECVWPMLCSQSGAVDLYLQKKDAFWQNRSFWVDEPMLHLMPHWNHAGHEGEPIRIVAYTNLPEAELFVNGKSMGKQTIERFGHAEWTAEYLPGTIECIGSRDGIRICSAVRQTTGRGMMLKLIPENAEDIHANGEDIALFTCVVLDGEGREVPDAESLVSFRTNGVGTVAATGSDDADHTPLSSSVRRMYEGRITIAVRCPSSPGRIVLYAHAEGLSPCRAEVDVNI